MNVKYAISVDQDYVVEVSKAIVSSILFHRLFGLIQPQTRQVLGIPYPCPVNPQLDSAVNDKVNELITSLRSSGDGYKKSGQIVIKFFETVARRQSWFGKNEENVSWEQWNISINVLVNQNDSEREASREKTKRQLRDIFMRMVDTVNKNKGHIPAIMSTGLVPFPYEISVN